MSKTRYLQQLGHSWYLRVKVPPELQARVRNTHIRRALGTRDLDEANRRKWPALAQVRAYLDGLRSGTTPPLASVASAPPTLRPTTTPIAMPTGTLRAHGGLDALAEDWASTSTLKTVQYQRRQAYTELRAYLGRDCSLDHVTDALAAAYVDEQLSQSRDSVSTRRRKLSALRAFWEWMASRRYVIRPEFHRHSVAALRIAPFELYR